MRPALFRDLGIVGALLALLACVLVTAPLRVDGLPGSTVKILAGGGHGSGVHIGDGYIISAAHVMGEGMRLKLDNGEEQDVELLWANKAHDIALLRTKPTMQASSLDCRVANVGESVLAKGNPIALEFVSAWGVVSGREREIGPWKRALPLDAAIVMGMSGGPSFGSDGRVIGINVGVMVAALGGMYPSLTGFGFMVPAAAVCDLMGKRALA